MTESRWYEEHPGGGDDSVVVEGARIRSDEKQTGANEPLESRDNFEEEHPGGQDG